MPVVALEPHVVVKLVNRVLRVEGHTIRKARGEAGER
jgi:hypothetical protein